MSEMTENLQEEPTIETTTLEDWLIDNVEQNRALYDPYHPNYKKNDVKNGIWNSFVATLNNPEINAASLKKKWRTIVCAYKTSKKKPKSGSAAGRKKMYNRSLSFLDPYIVSDNSDDRVSSVDVEIQNEESVSTDNADTFDDSSIGDTEASSSRPPSTRPSSSMSNYDQRTGFYSPSVGLTNRGPFASPNSEVNRDTDSSKRANTSASGGKNKRQKTSVESCDEQINELLETVEEAISSINKQENTTQDSVGLFCDSLKDILRQLTLTRFVLCQTDILQVISKYLERDI